MEKSREILPEKLKKRMEAIWNFDYVERFGIAVKGPLNPEKWDPSRIEKPDDPAELENYYTNPEYMHERALYALNNLYYEGDAFPVLFPFCGTAGHTKYFPVDYEYRKETIWFFPKFDSLSEINIQFDENNPAFLRERECLKRLAELAAGLYSVAQPDNCGSIDMLAQLIGSDNLMMEMISEPDLVEKSIQGAVDTLIRSGDQFIDLLRPTCDGGSCQGWLNLWSPGKMMQLQCDLSVMISPEMFERFVMPELEMTTAWLDHSIYHLDGCEQIRHLDMLLSLPKLNMIQWQPVEGQPPITDFIHILQKIQKAGKGLLLFCWSHEVKQLVNALSPKGVMLIVRDDNLTQEQAGDLVSLVTRASLSR